MNGADARQQLEQLKALGQQYRRGRRAERRQHDEDEEEEGEEEREDPQRAAGEEVPVVVRALLRVPQDPGDQESGEHEEEVHPGPSELHPLAHKARAGEVELEAPNFVVQQHHQHDRDAADPVEGGHVAQPLGLGLAAGHGFRPGWDWAAPGGAAFDPGRPGQAVCQRARITGWEWPASRHSLRAPGTRLHRLRLERGRR